MAKVVSRKLVLGDRFDVVGADGAAAFVTGAVDGALNVVGPALGKNLLPAGAEQAAAAAARSAAPKTFGQFAATTGAKMTENAATSGISSAVETLAQDKTWADGFDQGMRAVLANAATGAATGAGVSALPGSAAAMVAIAGSLEQFEAIINQFPEVGFSLEKVTLTPPLPADASVQQLPVQRVGETKFSNKEIGDEFERYVDERLWKDGLGGQVPKMSFVISGEHNVAGNGIDRTGVVIHADGTMTVYHFEMKFRSEPTGGAANPSTKLGEPSRGTQLGHDWTQGALTDLSNASSSHPPAMAVFDATRAMIAKARSKGKSPVDVNSVSPGDVHKFLAASLNATRVVVVPVHVDSRQLLRQIADLIKSNLDVHLATVDVTKGELAARRAKRTGK
jgi:hypothetical protein